MPAAPDQQTKACQIPSVLRLRVEALARLYGRSRADIYRAAARVVADAPPPAPVAYPEHARVERARVQVAYPEPLAEVVDHLCSRYFFRRLGWLYLYGCSDAQRIAALLDETEEHLVLRDAQRYAYWLKGGQPTWIPTTARAPGVRSRRRSSRR